MRRIRTALTCLAVAIGVVSGAPAMAQAQTSDNIAPHLGVWRNPKDTVHVEIKRCGDDACGYVIWANAKAQADARKGGTQNLIGLQLLRDFAPEKNGDWRGKVFVPDLNMTFSGTAQFVDTTTLRATGCLLAKVLCKTQVWRRVTD
jgi:uncharacterized protein (DUF2147 family)